jgi:uncharacterized membrane protein
LGKRNKGEMMLELLKIIHFLALAAGVGIGVANMVLGIRASKSEGPETGILRQAQGALGRVALGAIVVLWASGIWLWVGFNSTTTDPLFLAKIGFVVILTGLSIDMNLRATRAAKGGTPVDPAYAKRAGMLMGLMSLSIISVAVLFFTTL